MHISITFYRTLHILMTSQFDSLKRLLESHRNATKFDPTKRNELYGLNVWIIHVIGEENRENLEQVLQNCPLNFNSHVFEFFDTIEGMHVKCVHCK